MDSHSQPKDSFSEKLLSSFSACTALFFAGSFIQVISMVE